MNPCVIRRRAGVIVIVAFLFFTSLAWRYYAQSESLVRHPTLDSTTLVAAEQAFKRTPHPLHLVPLRDYHLSPSLRLAFLTQATNWCHAKVANEAVRIHAVRLTNLAKESLTDGHQILFYSKLQTALLDSGEHERRFHGLPVLFDTPYGAGYRTRPGEHNVDPPELADVVSGMTHVDKVLSTLGELDVSLDTEIVTHSGRRRVLMAVLEDSLQRWHPNRENEWTLAAYCSYLDEQREWKDAKGNKRCVDDVLNAVYKHKRGSPCYGTHRLYGLARACSRARVTPNFFTASLVRQAENELIAVSKTLACRQHAGGY
jgi:hypothetical protein